MTTLPASSPVLSRRTSLAVIALAALTVAACWLIPPAKSGGEVGVNMDLPVDLDGLEGLPTPVSQAERQILPPDTEFAGRIYGPFSMPATDWWDRFLCKIVLSGREKRSIHRPERCLPGQGWSVIDSQVVSVPLKSGHPLEVTALVLTRPVTKTDGTPGQLKMCYDYWYVGRSVSTPYSFMRVLLTNWDLIAHRSNQRWSYVICAAYVTDNVIPGGRTQEETSEALKGFIREAVPTFVKSEMPAEPGIGL
jgi:hypothetical protein